MTPDCQLRLDDATRSFTWAENLGLRAPSGMPLGELVDWGLRQSVGSCYPPRPGSFGPRDLEWLYRFTRAYLVGLVGSKRTSEFVATALLTNQRASLISQGADPAALPTSLYDVV